MDGLPIAVDVCLMDGDIIPYEIGNAMQPEGRPLPWSTVKGNVDKLIAFVKERTGAKEMILYLSETGNYRLKVASVKKYKGQRMAEKPYWFYNIRHYLYRECGAVAVYGKEADDEMSIQQRRLNAEGTVTCIASRDKDLRIVPGWHYSWPCGDYQPEIPLFFVDEIGELWPKWGKPSKTGSIPLKDLKGCGLKFFYAQMIMGDVADNIPGAPKKGAKVAYEAIKDCETEEEMFQAVSEVYAAAYGKQTDVDGRVKYADWQGIVRRKPLRKLIREQGILLNMQRWEGDIWNLPTST